MCPPTANHPSAVPHVSRPITKFKNSSGGGGHIKSLLPLYYIIHAALLLLLLLLLLFNANDYSAARDSRSRSVFRFVFVLHVQESNIYYTDIYT